MAKHPIHTSDTSYKPNCADEYLELIHDIAIDYDGRRTVVGLKSLIDEMTDYASKARKCLHSGDIFRKDGGKNNVKL